MTCEKRHNNREEKPGAATRQLERVLARRPEHNVKAREQRVVHNGVRSCWEVVFGAMREREGEAGGEEGKTGEGDGGGRERGLKMMEAFPTLPLSPLPGPC